MAGPVADVAERGIKSFMNTMREVGTDKAVSEALIGGAGGVGVNMAYNVATGDSGGYMGAGLLGGAAGGLGRTGLKHFKLETQASNLISTFSGGAVNAFSKAQKAVGSATGESAAKTQVMRHGKEEYSTQQYQRVVDEGRKIQASLLKTGNVTQAKEEGLKTQAINNRRKELEREGRKMQGLSNKEPKQPKKWVSPEDKERYITSPDAVKTTEARAKANKPFTDTITSNRDAARSKIERNKSQASYDRLKGQTNSPPKPFTKPNDIQGSSVMASGQHSSLDSIMQNSSFDYKGAASLGTKQQMTKTLNNGMSKKAIKAQGAADMKKYGDAENSLANIQQNMLANSLHKFG